MAAIDKLPIILFPETRHVYSPVNRCIYCSAIATPSAALTAEHIWPKSLGGNYILPAASCGDCQNETHAFEGACTGALLKQTRAHLGIRSSSKPPRELPVAIFEADGFRSWKSVPVSEHPRVTALPVFFHPGMTVGDTPHEGFRVRFFFDIAPGAIDKMRRVGIGAGSAQKFHPTKFAQMIAKIAHGFAIAEIGESSFVPTLPDVILNKHKFTEHYVGGSDEAPTDDPKRGSVKIYRGGLQNELLLVKVRFLPELGTPTYEAVAGTLL